MEMLRFGEFDPVPVFNAAKHGTTEKSVLEKEISDVDVVGEKFIGDRIESMIRFSTSEKQMSDFEKEISDVDFRQKFIDDRVKDIADGVESTIVFNTSKYMDAVKEISDADVVRAKNLKDRIESMGRFITSENYIYDFDKNTKLYFLIAIDTSTQKSHGMKMDLLVDTSKENMIQELGNRALRYDFVPRYTITPHMIPTLSGATQLVSVRRCIVGIGGGHGMSKLPSRSVFELYGLLQLHAPLPSMLQKRAYPAVVSLGGNIYVFGGLAPFQEGSSPWAEYLDPTGRCKWKKLKDPISPHLCSQIGCTQLFAFPYDAQTILIGCGVLPDKDGLLYNVADKSWSRYQSFPKIRPWNFARPVTFDSTIYWIEGLFLMAYEMEKRIYLCVDLSESESVFSYTSFLSPAHVPHLVHLEDDLFGFFTSNVFGQEARGVECTKVRVTKVYSAHMDLPGTLDLTVVGYENFMCPQIDMLSSVVSCEIATHFIMHESGIKNLADLPMVGVTESKSKVGVTESKSKVGVTESKSKVGVTESKSSAGGNSGGRQRGHSTFNKVVVEGLPSTLSGGEFCQYFASFGKLTEAVVLTEQQTLQPRGFGVIAYDCEDAVDSVFSNKNHVLGGRPVKVKRVRPGYEGGDGTSVGGSGRGYQGVNLL